MSLFLLYFETANPNSHDYSGYREVGKFSIPKEIFSGEKKVLFHNKSIRGGIISDESKMCANDLLLGKPNHARSLLISFISERLTNACINSHIFGYIEPSENPIAPTRLATVEFEELIHSLTVDNFENGHGFSINQRE